MLHTDSKTLGSAYNIKCCDGSNNIASTLGDEKEQL